MRCVCGGDVTVLLRVWGNGGAEVWLSVSALFWSISRVSLRLMSAWPLNIGGRREVGDSLGCLDGEVDLVFRNRLDFRV